MGVSEIANRASLAVTRETDTTLGAPTHFADAQYDALAGERVGNSGAAHVQCLWFANVDAGAARGAGGDRKIDKKRISVFNQAKRAGRADFCASRAGRALFVDGESYQKERLVRRN